MTQADDGQGVLSEQSLIWKTSCWLWPLVRIVTASLAGLSFAAELPQYHSQTNRVQPTIGLLSAVRLTLSQDANIHIQEQQRKVSQGALQEAAGQFDPTLQSSLSRSLTRLPLTDATRQRFDPLSGQQFLEPRSTLVTDDTEYHFGVRKQFRSGPSLTPGITLQRLADNIDQENGVNRASIDLQLNVPLLKGFGPAAADAVERAARAAYEASALDLQHVIASRVLNTVSAYWRCLQAVQELEIWRVAERSAGDLVENVESLIKAEEFAPGEAQQVRAFVAERATQRIAAEQQVEQTRQDLGLAMGLTPQDLPLAPLPSEPFPEPITNAVSALFRLPPPVDLGLSRRADYQSSLKAQQASEILAKAAKLNTKPQLDLTLSAGYAGLDEGTQFGRFFGSARPANLSGLNLQGVLLFQYPIGNQTARGILLQREAALQQTILRRTDLARTISSRIVVALSDLERSMEALRSAQESVNRYTNAVANEEQKLKLGISTVLDEITIANRLSDARLNLVAARSRYATALAELRFETGFLVSSSTPQSMTLNGEDFRSVPEALIHPGKPPPAPRPAPDPLKD